MVGPRFVGFPEGRLKATVIPSLFISELLEQIDDLGELKLALYLFWRFGQKKAFPRFLTRGEIEAETVIRKDLSALGANALDAALNGLVERGLILRRTMELN